MNRGIIGKFAFFKCKISVFLHDPNPLNDKRMKATVSLDSIWNLIQLLCPDNQKWLADKVYEEIGKKKADKELEFLHIPANRELSQEVRNMVADCIRTY